MTIQVGSAASQTITIASDNDTLATLASYIDAGTGSTSGDADGYGVTAQVITNADGTQSLALADDASGAGALSVNTSNPGGGGSDDSSGGSSNVTFSGQNGTGSATDFTSAYNSSSMSYDQDQTVTLTGTAGSDVGDLLTGSISLTTGSGNPWVIEVDNMDGDTPTLDGLAQYINGQNGYTASAQDQNGAAVLTIVGPFLDGESDNTMSVDASNLSDANDARFANGTLTTTAGLFGSASDSVTGSLTITGSVDPGASRVEPSAPPLTAKP